MGFVPFLLFGWVRIVCRTCKARLILRTPGERFWRTLAAGATAAAAIWFLLDYPFRALGERWTLILFVAVVVLTLFLSMYFAWKDSRFELAPLP
ncbi:MAG TPA: hypothetical protein VMM37_02340 [Bacteroidota bacterium]|nr:hypothetical protein [Bacteroidota bacterium]